MSTPPDRPLDALGLARSAAQVERMYAVGGFARLRDRLAEPTGEARARAAFRLAGEWPVAELAVEADLVLPCQRCLGPMRRRIESQSRLVFAAEDAAALPEGYEPVGVDPRRLELAAIVEDELLLSLPIVPQHAPGESCALPQQPAEAPDREVLRRPFAGLKDLMKH